MSEARTTAQETLHIVIEKLNDVLKVTDGMLNTASKERIKNLVYEIDDEVRNVMDQLVGWCSPNMELGGEDDFPKSK